MSKRICIGKIATAHGVRGLVKLNLYGDDPSSFEKYGPLYTGETENGTLRLSLKGRAGGHILAAVEGVADRDAAEALRGVELWLDRDRLPPTADDEYYHADLVGMVVTDTGGTRLGTVIAVANFGAGDLLDIQPDIGDSFYLPFTGDTVRSVDLDGKAILVDPPADA